MRGGGWKAVLPRSPFMRGGGPLRAAARGPRGRPVHAQEGVGKVGPSDFARAPGRPPVGKVRPSGPRPGARTAGTWASTGGGATRFCPVAHRRAGCVRGVRPGARTAGTWAQRGRRRPAAGGGPALAAGVGAASRPPSGRPQSRAAPAQHRAPRVLRLLAAPRNIVLLGCFAFPGRLSRAGRCRCAPVSGLEGEGDRLAPRAARYPARMISTARLPSSSVTRVGAPVAKPRA